MMVDQQMLTEDLGFTRFHAMKMEKFARHGWRPKMLSASGNPGHPQQRRAGSVYSDSTVQHAAVFTWSKDHVTVRDLFVRRLWPTIVRISKDCTWQRPEHHLSFYEGTVSIRTKLISH